jgi:Ca2+-binding RTX toxin-like protein
MNGGSFEDTLAALNGDDVLEGLKAGDALNGGGGNDTASYRQSPGGVTADLLNAGNNTGHAKGDVYSSIENLSGSAFKDKLSGNDLANVIAGGPELDILTGRGGRDVFRFDTVQDSPAGPHRDTNADFNGGIASTVADRIDVSAIDAIAGPRNDVFVFIGSARFSGKAGELRAKVSGSDTLVAGDVDGDGAADIEILLAGFTNITALTKSDFRL